MLEKQIIEALKMYYEKKLTSVRKQTVSELLQPLQRFQKAPKAVMIDHISRYVAHQWEILKEVEGKTEQAISIGIRFLPEKVNTAKAKADLEAIFTLYFHKKNDAVIRSSRLPRFSQQSIVNVWNKFTSSYACVCPSTANQFPFLQSSFTCYACGKSFHNECFWDQTQKKIFQCPLCFLKNCIPNKPTMQVLFVGYVPKTEKNKIQYKISFEIDPRRENYEIRCVSLNAKNEYELTWPSYCLLSVNNTNVLWLKPLNEHSSCKKRVDAEVELDRRLLHPHDLNEIILQCKHNFARNYRAQEASTHLLTIVAVDLLSEKELVNRIQSRRPTVKECLWRLPIYFSSNQMEVAIQKINISFQCQLFQTQIILPARSKHCTPHCQPFDLKNFILVNCKYKNTLQRWKCPICKQRAYDIVVDSFLYSLIQSQPNLREISLNSDGTYQKVEHNKIYKKKQFIEEQDCNIKTQQNIIYFNEQKIICIDIQDEEKSKNNNMQQQEMTPVRIMDENQQYQMFLNKHINKLFEEENSIEINEQMINNELNKNNNNQIMSANQHIQFLAQKKKEQKTKQKVQPMDDNNEIIEIESDHETAEQAEKKKLLYHLGELEKQKQTLSQMYSSAEPTEEDEECFARICASFDLILKDK